MSHKRVTLEEKEYIAGFIDGDGCITLPKPSHSNKKPGPVVSMSQACDHGKPPELRHARRMYGGKIYRHGRKVGNGRTQWSLKCFSVQETERLLRILSDHGTVKRAEADCALEYIESNKSDPLSTWKALLTAKGARRSVTVDHSRITPSYIAGLFAAEGSVGLFLTSRRAFNLTAAIAQKCCTPLLEAIKSKLGYGHVCSRGNLQFSSGPQARKFLKFIKPHMKKSQKKPQVKKALKWHSLHRRRPGYQRSEKELDEIRKIVAKLKEMKRM